MQNLSLKKRSDALSECSAGILSEHRTDTASKRRNDSGPCYLIISSYCPSARRISAPYPYLRRKKRLRPSKLYLPALCRSIYLCQLVTTLCKAQNLQPAETEKTRPLCAEKSYLTGTLPESRTCISPERWDCQNAEPKPAEAPCRGERLHLIETLNRYSAEAQRPAGTQNYK